MFHHTYFASTARTGRALVFRQHILRMDGQGSVGALNVCVCVYLCVCVWAVRRRITQRSILAHTNECDQHPPYMRHRHKKTYTMPITHTHWCLERSAPAPAAPGADRSFESIHQVRILKLIGAPPSRQPFSEVWRK